MAIDRGPNDADADPVAPGSIESGPVEPDVEPEEPEEALTWAGDADRPGGVAPEAPASTAPAAPVDRAALRKARRESALVAAYGVAGGVYLVWTVLWILGAGYVDGGPGTAFGDFMAQFGEFLAIIACPLWFVTTMLLTRDARPVLRFAWLVLGIAVLVPWPFLLLVGA